jgi:hypothetical protein
MANTSSMCQRIVHYPAKLPHFALRGRHQVVVPPTLTRFLTSSGVQLVELTFADISETLVLPGKSLSFLQFSIESVLQLCFFFALKSCCCHNVLIQTTSSLRANHSNNFLL